jgi:hypothetical protein
MVYDESIDVYNSQNMSLNIIDPGKLPLKDSRTPDIIVRPNFGTIYTTSSHKNAEHGGFGWADTSVALIVSNPALLTRTLKTPVVSSQVAPTILRALGIDPQQLKSVREEKTRVLPGLGLD